MQILSFSSVPWLGAKLLVTYDVVDEHCYDLGSIQLMVETILGLAVDRNSDYT